MSKEISPMEIISIQGLKKSFKGRKGKGQGKGKAEPVHAVNGIDLSVQEGEIFGFLGPNGAGKTTTLRILATLMPADEGKVAIAGCDVRKEPRSVRRLLGYVSQAGGTDPLATGRENMMLQARLYGLAPHEAKARVDELIEALELGAFVDRFARTLSGGQRRKVDIAVGMIHRPKLLFLDEPTTGLDPVSRAQLWAQIRALRKMGTTVFLTTHYMEEADALCDRVAIMDKGRIVAQGSPLSLKREIKGDILSLTVNHVENAPDIATGALRELEMVREITSEGSSLRVVVTHGGEALPVVLKILEGKGVGVADIALSRPTLDDVFLNATGHSLKEEAAAVSGKE
jgi:ABC-2 type transport system ATP-binding protein